MFDWITATVGALGAFGVALLMFLENVFPPVPSEVIMPLAGFVSSRDSVGFWTIVIAGTAGSLTGATLWYVVGRRVGEERLRDWVSDHGRWLTVSVRDLDRAMSWFQRHGGSAVFIGRLVPGVRTVISLPAGFARMAMVPFLAWSTAGTFLWSGALALAGRLLGTQYDRVSRFIDPVTSIALAILLGVYLYRVIRWNPSRYGTTDGGRSR